MPQSDMNATSMAQSTLARQASGDDMRTRLSVENFANQLAQIARHLRVYGDKMERVTDRLTNPQIQGDKWSSLALGEMLQ